MNFEPGDDDVVSVIDYSGTEIIRKKVDGSENQIIFQEPLKTGTYIIKYTSANFQRKERLLVKSN